MFYVFSAVLLRDVFNDVTPSSYLITSREEHLLCDDIHYLYYPQVLKRDCIGVSSVPVIRYHGIFAMPI